MPPPSRQQLMELAARHRLPVLEDGFDGALYDGRPPGPLKALDRAGQVIYVGTFSKVLFPGLRLGWIVAAPELVERLLAAKQLADIHTSPLLQAAVYHFCQRRLLERHQARALREYERRRDALLAALAVRMPEGVSWTEPQGGFSLLLTLPAGLDAIALLGEAQARGVAYTPGDAFFADGGGERLLRLSFSGVPAGEMDEGVRRLGEAIAAGARQGAARAREPEAAVPLV
jgi:2-aminoadipate transaminase